MPVPLPNVPSAAAHVNADSPLSARRWLVSGSAGIVRRSRCTRETNMDGEVLSDGRFDVYRRITDNIMAAIEAGPGVFRMPWHSIGPTGGRPVNALTGRPYRGVNVVTLWADARLRGYDPVTGQPTARGGNSAARCGRASEARLSSSTRRSRSKRRTRMKMKTANHRRHGLLPAPRACSTPRKLTAGRRRLLRLKVGSRRSITQKHSFRSHAQLQFGRPG